VPGISGNQGLLTGPAKFDGSRAVLAAGELAVADAPADADGAPLGALAAGRADCELAEAATDSTAAAVGLARTIGAGLSVDPHPATTRTIGRKLEWRGRSEIALRVASLVVAAPPHSPPDAGFGRDQLIRPPAER
jgi:hypothetical protein